MAQKRVQKYNPVTRKYEWVNVDMPADNKRLVKPKNPEHEQLAKWVNEFDAVTAKPKRTNSDYAFLIRKLDGIDVAPSVLNSAKSAGLIDEANYRKRLKQYQDIRAETAKTPMLDAKGNPVTYRNRVTNKEHTMMRSMWIKDGNYDYTRSFGDVANEASAKREGLVKQQQGYRPPSEAAEAAKHIGRMTAGTFNRKTIPGFISGINKGYTNAAFDTIGAAESLLNTQNQSLFDWGGSGNRITPEQFNMLRAGMVNHEDYKRAAAEGAINNALGAIGLGYDETAGKISPEDQIANVVAGNVDPRNVHESAGMEFGNFAGTLGSGLGATMLASAIAPEVGIPAGIANLGMMGLQTVGGITEMLTGDARYNPFGNFGGAVRKQAGAYAEPSERAIGMAHEQAKTVGPLAMVAALTSALVTKKVPSVLTSGNYKQGLKEAVNGVKTIQATAAANAEATAIAEGAQGMGLRVATNPSFAQQVGQGLLRATPLAVEGVTNTAVPLAQAIAHSTIRPDIPEPEAMDFLQGAAFGVLAHAPKGTLPAKFNEFSHNLTRDAEIKYGYQAQHRAQRQQLSRQAPIISHLTKNVGLTYEEALAYVSHEFEQAYPGAKMPKSSEDAAMLINSLPSAQILESNKATNRFQPVVDDAILNTVRNGQTKSFTTPGGIKNEQTQVTPLVSQINPSLRKYTNQYNELRTNVGLLKARKQLTPPTVTPDSAATQLETNKRGIPMASMIVETSEGPRKIIYSHDLKNVFVTEDLKMPTHELHADTYEIGAGHIPRENYAPGIARMNSRENSDIRWSHTDANGHRYDYQFVGHGNGRIIVDRTTNGGMHTLYEMTPREIEVTVPESMKERIAKLRDDMSEAFGTKIDEDGVGTAVNYTRTDFSKADRDLFPSMIFRGKTAREGRGALPARKIASDKAFNTYQLPNGAVIKVPKFADTANESAPVMAPVDTRMETVIGTRYAQDLITQANSKDHPGYYHVILSDGTERTIYVSEAIQKDIQKNILNPTKEAIYDATVTGADVKTIINDANGKLLDRLLRISKTGQKAGDEINYNYGYTDTPIQVGDVVDFIDHEKDGKSRPSIVRRAGHERAVVVGIDYNGVHVKLANELPGLMGKEGGRTVVVHPDNLQPAIQPHLGSIEKNMRPISSVEDVEAAFGYGTKSEEAATTEVPAPTEPAVYDPSVDAGVYNDSVGYVTGRLSENGTVEHLAKTFTDIAADRNITPDALRDGIVNLLNGDGVTYIHKEALIHSLLALDLDSVSDLNSLVKLNHTLDGVADWLRSENRPVDLVSDISTMFSGEVLDKTPPVQSAQEHAGAILNKWNKGTVRLSTVIDRYFRSKAGENLSPEERSVIQTRVAQLSMVIPQLRTYLNGRNVVDGKVWNYVARLSAADQLTLYKTMQQNMFKSGWDTTKPTSVPTLQLIKDLASVNDLVPSRKSVPKANAIKYDAYRALVDEAITAYRREVNTRGRDMSVTEVSKSDGSGNIADVNAFLRTLSGEDAPEIRKQVFEALGKQEITEQEFTTLFSGLRFPGQEITVGEVANHLKNGTLGDFVDASNEMRAATLQLRAMEDVNIEVLEDIIKPFLGRVDDDVYDQMMTHIQNAHDALMSPRNENASLSHKQTAFISDMNAAVTLGLRHSSPDPELVASYVSSARTQYNSIKSKTLKAMELQVAYAEAQAKIAGQEKPIVKINDEASSAVVKTTFDLNADNLSEVPEGVRQRMSQEEFDTIRATHEENNKWLESQKSPRVTSVPVEFPFIDVADIGAQTPEGAGVTIIGSTADAREGLIVAFKKAMNLESAAPEIKAVGDQLAEAYADAYDLHAYSYATRHAEYEFRTGRVDDCNTQVRQILNAQLSLASTPERALAIQGLLKRLDDGLPLFTSSGNSFINEIVAAFPKSDSAFAEKLSSYIFTSRIGKLQHEFYTNNGNLIITAADLSKNTGPLYMSFASLTAEGMNRTADRAGVNLLLHLNRTSNRSRDVLSVGHELHHGLFHTMPLIQKLKYAQDVLGAIMKAHGFTEGQGDLKGRSAESITDIVSTYKLVTRELDALKQKRANLAKLAESGKIEDVNALEKFDYETTIDMHADTNHWMYKNTLLNEAVVSSLVTGSMGMKPIYDGANFTIAYTASGLFNRVGAFINKAVQLMNRRNPDKTIATDYRVTSEASGLITDAQHRWKVRYNEHFVIRDKNGKPISFARLPETAMLSFISTGKSGLKGMPVYTVDGSSKNKLIPTTTAVSNASPEVVPPAVGRIGKESYAMSVYGNYVSFKADSQSLAKLKADGTVGEPSFVMNGTAYYRMDFDNGVAVNSISGVKFNVKHVNDHVYGLVNAVSRVNKEVTIVRPEQLLDMNNVRISGDAPGWNSNLASLMYAMYAKNDALSIAATGQMDWATHRNMKRYVVEAGVDINRMPGKNVQGFDVSSPEYGQTPEGKAASKSTIAAMNSMREQAGAARDAIADYIDNLEVDEANATRKSVNESVDDIRRALFGLDEFDDPLTAIVTDENLQSSKQFVPSILTSETGNTRAVEGMFHVTRDGNATPEIQVIRQVAKSVGTHIPADQMGALADVILQSHDLNSFQKNLFDSEKHGISPESAGEILTAIGEEVERINAGVEQHNELNPTNPRNAISPDSVMHNLRTIALGSREAIGDTVDGSKFRSSIERLASNDNDMTPNVSGQRDFVLTAVRNAAASQGMHEVAFLKRVNESPAGIEAMTLLATSNAMAIDVANRSSAMRNYNNWELAGVKYLTSRKAPMLIMRSKGVESRYSDVLTGRDTSKFSYVAIDQTDSSVRPAVPVEMADGSIDYIIVKTSNAPSSGYGNVRNYERMPTTSPKRINEINWLMQKPASEGAKFKSSDTVSFKTWFDGTSALEKVLSNVNVVTHTQIKNAIGSIVQEMTGSRNATKTVDVTLPFYVLSGVDSASRFNAENKPSNILDVFRAIDAYDRRDPNLGPGNLQMRHMRIKIDKVDGLHKVTFTDLGGVNSTSTVHRRTMGQSSRMANGGMQIAPQEAYIARHLLAIEAYKEMNGQDNFFSTFENGKKTSLITAPEGRTEISRPSVITAKDKEPRLQSPSTWKEWKGNSVFSDGYNMSDFIDHVQDPVHTTPAETKDSTDAGDVQVTHDPTLLPHELVVDIDGDGIHQVRGGSDKKGWHKAWSTVGEIITEADGLFRTIKLAGDVSVALNQSWFVANPVTFLEHFAWARKNQLSAGMHLGPGLTAMGGAPTMMLPNAPGLLMAMTKNSPVKASRWGDNYVHAYMEKVLSRTNLTLEDMEHYGLNLEYIKWNREYKTALAQDPNIAKQDVPLQLRLSDYYGDSKLAQRIIPLVAMKERFNALYKDLAAVTEFQKRYLEVQAMNPPEYSLQTIDQFRGRQLRDSAEAINILQGMQKGEVSPSKGLGFFQRLVSKMVTSAKYRHSRLMLTPVVGRLLYLGKQNINRVSNKIINKDIASTRWETKIFADAAEGGFTPEVKRYLSRRLWQGFSAQAVMQAAMRAGTLATIFKALFSGDEEQRKEGAQLILDEISTDGYMKVAFGGHEYRMPMPGGIASAVRQNTKLRATSPSSIAKLPEWAFRQYVVNQLSPTVQVARMALSGSTFSGDNAWETNQEYAAWRNAMIERYGTSDAHKEVLKAIYPANLSRFVTELGSVASTDNLKDIALKREGLYARGEDPNITTDDVGRNYIKQVINFFGGGLVDFDPEYDEWTKQSMGADYDNMKRYKYIEEQRKAHPNTNLVDEIRTKGLGAAVHGDDEEGLGW